MKTPNLPTIPEKDFQALYRWAKDYIFAPAKPLKHLDFEAECGFFGWQNSQGFTRNLVKSSQNMIPKRTGASPDLFGVSLLQVINLDHPLVRLSCLFDWEEIRREIEPSFCDNNGRPGADVRVVVGLFYLKSAFNLSDEQLLARWVENPCWQWFCCIETMQHKPPIDPTTLSRWRSRFGSDKLEVLLKQTFDTANQRNLRDDYLMS